MDKIFLGFFTISENAYYTVISPNFGKHAVFARFRDIMWDFGILPSFIYMKQNLLQDQDTLLFSVKLPLTNLLPRNFLEDESPKFFNRGPTSDTIFWIVKVNCWIFTIYKCLKENNQQFYVFTLLICFDPFFKFFLHFFATF